MKWQSVLFRRSNSQQYQEEGIAKVNFYWGDISFIVDQDGLRVKCIFDYEFIEGPLNFIDSEYN